MTRDDFVALLILASFAAWLTAHCVLVALLARDKPRTLALLALFVVPTAPYLAWRSGRAILSSVWMAACVTWCLTRLLLGR